MKVTRCYCDICKRIREPKDLVSMKIKSDSFITYENCDMWGANKKTWDICFDCLEAIGEAIAKTD